MNDTKNTTNTNSEDQKTNSNTYQSPYMKAGDGTANSPTQGEKSSGGAESESKEVEVNQPNKQNVAVQSGGFENFISGGEGSSPKTPPTSNFAKKSAGGKYIATILGIILLVGGIGAGVFLVQQNQEIREQAQTSTAECSESTNCVLLEDPGDSGSQTVNGFIYNVFLTTDQVHSFNETVTEDGCYRVDIQSDTVNWERVSTAPECEDVVNIQIWTTGSQTQSLPSYSAQCQEIKIFDTSWNRLSTSDLSNLSAGETIRLTVSGSTTDGAIEQARFIINNQTQPATNTVRQGTNEFYQEYTIPENTTTFTVDAQLYHSSAGWF